MTERSKVMKRPHNKLEPVPLMSVKIDDPFWKQRQDIITKKSIHLQHEKLEEYGHIDNFRLAAGKEPKHHAIFRGAFFFDSDLYKWLEAACNVLELSYDEKLKSHVDELVDLIQEAQMKDGYLNTYYQCFFPDLRFSNLLIMHELYCMGHFFQAAVAHHKLTNKNDLIEVASKCVDLLIEKFLNAKLKGAPGHQEIELALFDLYKITADKKYFKLGKELIERRGTIPKYKKWAWKAFRNMTKTLKKAKVLTQEHEEKTGETYDIDKNSPVVSLGHKIKGAIRFVKEFLNGKYFQLHLPVRRAKIPVGHSVRAMYLYAGMADLYSETGDEELLTALDSIWEHMVEARMYVSGGTGSIGVLEGFGKDFELNNFHSYSETCAAIGNMMWNWRMSQITADPKHANLTERLLYNAMLVGPSLDGTTYMYNNPLASKGKDERKPWYYVACCPPNIARTITSLGKYIYSTSEQGIWIHQYISNEGKITLEEQTVELKMESAFPWKSGIKLTISNTNEKKFSIFLRIAPYMNEIIATINGKILDQVIKDEIYLEINRTWKSGDKIELNFKMEPTLIYPDERLTCNKGKVAIQHGPLIYCLEGKDNLGVNVLKAKIAQKPDLRVEHHPELLGGINVITGALSNKKRFKAIPYHAWLNRGPNKMTTWITKQK